MVKNVNWCQRGQAHPQKSCYVQNPRTFNLLSNRKQIMFTFKKLEFSAQKRLIIKIDVINLTVYN